MTSSNDKGNTAHNTTQANLQIQQQRGLWWEISLFTAVRHRQTLLAFLQIKDESGTVVACTRHHVRIDLVSGCFERKNLAFLNRTMWCSKPRMCCKKQSSFLFTIAPVDLFSFFTTAPVDLFSFFTTAPVDLFSFLLQHPIY